MSSDVKFFMISLLQLSPLFQVKVRAAVSIMVLLGLTWILGPLMLIDVLPEFKLTIQYLFTVCNSLQVISPSCTFTLPSVLMSSPYRPLYPFILPTGPTAGLIIIFLAIL